MRRSSASSVKTYERIRIRPLAFPPRSRRSREPFSQAGHSRIERKTSRADALPQIMSSAADSRAQHPSRRRILIVEDDYLVALQFENALTEAGYEVVDIASTAEEALQLVPAHQPELVVMGVRLAGPRDGIQAATEILDRFGVRSIFVSAFSDASTRARADRANPIAWLAKPVADRKLVSTVNSALRDMGGGADTGSGAS